MNIEIKFRAFIDGKMIDADSLAFEQYEPVSKLLTYCENIMQYTGIKDKNGKEIYEGDIVTFPEYYETPEMTNTNYVTAKVVFEYGCFHIKQKNQEKLTPDTNSLAYEMQCYDGDFEVIGNIYENPELIKS